MSDGKLKVGDLVYLKSNGPILTVDTVREDGIIVCVWFAGDCLKRDTFPPETLRPRWE